MGAVWHLILIWCCELLCITFFCDLMLFFEWGKFIQPVKKSCSSISKIWSNTKIVGQKWRGVVALNCSCILNVWSVFLHSFQFYAHFLFFINVNCSTFSLLVALSLGFDYFLVCCLLLWILYTILLMFYGNYFCCSIFMVVELIVLALDYSSSFWCFSHNAASY